LRLRMKCAAPLCAIFVAVTAASFSPGNSSIGAGPCLAEPADAESDVTLLAQLEEGDIDESFEAYGDDSDEIFEYDEALMAPLDSLVEGIRWLGHASFLIEDRLAVYVDPYDIAEELAGKLPKADIILVTHDHRDHFSPDDIQKLAKPATAVVSIQPVVDELPEGIKNSQVVAPGDTVTVKGLTIEAVPAYNIGKRFHPRDKGYVGFVIHLEDRTVYHAGDTDLIPEMEQIDADVALLPVGGTYTMNAAEAAKAADVIKPEVAIPMHWGKIVGTLEDAKDFQARCKTRVLVPKEAASRKEK
jgi:L-ascorbate metabolism protein UlaG (beta-lactamase superfamily)